MAKKRGKQTNIGNLLFDEVDPYGALVGAEVPTEVYALDTILPDFQQPRRLLPPALGQALRDGEITPAEAMGRWLDQAKSDTTVKQAVRELRRLATAIEKHGLINPITIRPATADALPAPYQYLVVTGERRYWAHVLLHLEGRHIQEGEAIYDPQQVRARLLPSGASVRAHQLIENIVREDINVVEKAQGLWALRRELSHDAYRRHGKAGSGKSSLVPWKQVEETLDMSRQYRARIIAVLALSEAAQSMIRTHHLAEATIRPIAEKLRPYPDLQMQALKQLVAWQEAEARGESEGRRIVPSVRALVAKLLDQQEKKAQKKSAARPKIPEVGKLGLKIRSALRFMQRLENQELTALTRQLAKDKSYADVVDDLEALRNQIDAILHEIKDDDS